MGDIPDLIKGKGGAECALLVCGCAASLQKNNLFQSGLCFGFCQMMGGSDMHGDSAGGAGRMGKVVLVGKRKTGGQLWQMSYEIVHGFLLKRVLRRVRMQRYTTLCCAAKATA